VKILSEPGHLEGFKFSAVAPYRGVQKHQFRGEDFMRLQYFAVAGLAVCLLGAAPVLAQTKAEGAGSNEQTTETQQPGNPTASDPASGPAMGATKQRTQAGANFQPPQYGAPYKAEKGRIQQ